MDVMQTIKDILQENLDIDPETVTAESTLDDLGIDSLDTVELICDLEERCNIEMGYPEGLNSIGDVVNYIENL
ncbi:MAG: acyl carrier protein [Coriobacteriaceae bacterium]|nr:acyl carrier protein [Coriobacteriaceae bacterium]